MNRSALVTRIAAQNPHLQQRQIERVVNTILAHITDTLAAGGRVELRDFGTFALKRRDAREGCNPRTRARIDIPAKADVRFRPGRAIQERLNLDPKPAALAAE